jgi:hypothetical protein
MQFHVVIHIYIVFILLDAGGRAKCKLMLHHSEHSSFLPRTLAIPRRHTTATFHLTQPKKSSPYSILGGNFVLFECQLQRGVLETSVRGLRLSPPEWYNYQCVHTGYTKTSLVEENALQAGMTD